MLGLPSSTEIRRQLPKAALAQKFSLKPQERRLLDQNVSRLEIVNQISPQTIPALAAGAKVKAVFVLKIELKKRDFDTQVLQLILKFIPQKLILALCSKDEVRLAVFHEKLLLSEWLPAASCHDAYPLTLRGTDLDAVWVNLKSRISGIALPPDAAHTEECFTEALHAEEERVRLQKQIRQLERACRAEVQPRRKFDLHQQIVRLKRQLNHDAENEST